MADQTHISRFAEPTPPPSKRKRSPVPVILKGLRTKLRALADKLVEQGLEGNVHALKEIADRLDGKAIQQMQIDREDRIKFIAVVPEKSATTEDWLKLIGEERVIEHQPTDLESTD
jgi:hypothetical protein